MKILISGSSGFLGKETSVRLSQMGYDVYFLVRKEPKNEKEFFFNPLKGEIAEKALEGTSVVINFSGESIYGLWTKSKREKILSSRLLTTQFLSEKIVEKNEKITFISTSAVGFYGFEREEKVDENSAKGSGFLADVCEYWEKEALKSENVSRVILSRFGIVLGKNGGMLKKILPLTKIGFFGRIGDGEQFFPWIAVEEIPFIFDFFLKNSSLKGAVNIVSPNIVKNRDFANILKNVLKKKELFFIPSFPLKIFGGKMAREMLLGGANVFPKVLIQNGYNFHYTKLENYLRSIFS